MQAPEYNAPDSLDAALDLKRVYGESARVIAGGTDLILRLQEGIYAPCLLLDLRHLAMDTISVNNDRISLGSCVNTAQILEHRKISECLPALVEACRQFAGPPIRNRGTIGGNIVNSSPAADLVPPLMTYDAEIVLTNSSSDRHLPLHDFFTGPGENVMQAEEILTEVHLPVPVGKTASVFSKLGQRRSMAISIVNLAARITVSESGVINSARIALGAVAPTPVRVIKTEELLLGEKLSDTLISKVARQASDEVSPINDTRASEDYRLKMVIVLVQRALLEIKDKLET